MKQTSFFLPGDDCEEMYRDVRDRDDLVHIRNNVERLWVSYSTAHLSDPTSQSDAKKHFQQRFWEMYLGCALLNLGFSLQKPPNTANQGPEFYCHFDGQKCWFEAISPGPGEGDDAVPEWPTMQAVATEFPEDEILLRIRGAIHDKHKKHLSDLNSGVVSGEDACVICINASRVRSMIFDSTAPLIVKAVFPIGNLAIPIDSITGVQLKPFHTHRDKLQKLNGELVFTNVFLDPQYSGISGVLYSLVDVRFDPKLLGADFILVHNPLAKHPLGRGVIRVGVEYWYEANHVKWSKWGDVAMA